MPWYSRIDNANRSRRGSHDKRRVHEDSSALAACVACSSRSRHLRRRQASSCRRAPINAHDLASLQRGAKLFVNYCLNCHSAGYMRYNRLQDLGLTEQQIRDNLMFTGVKVGDLMKIAMDRKEAKEWFGVAPPDLTVVARRAQSGGRQRRGLALHLSARFLPRSGAADRLEQLVLRERRHAARAVAVEGRAAAA